MALSGYLLVFLLLIFFVHWAACIYRVPSSRPGTWAYHVGDGLLYNVNRISQNTVYLKCQRYERGCAGRALLNRFTGFQHTQGHNHDPDMLQPQYAEARLRILRRCAELQHVPFQRIVQEETRNCHRAVRGRLGTRALRVAMTRARRRAFPPLPQNLREVSELLQNPIYRGITATLDGTDNIYLGSVTANDGSHAVLFASRRMTNFMRNCHTLFSDGTFRSVPAVDGASQVFVIITNWNYHIIPLVWVIMERKTEVLYRAVLAFLSVLLGRRWRVRRVITDWEIAQRNAWSAIRPQSSLQGCFWHYCRAIIMYARNELHLQWWMRNDRFVRGIVRLCCAVPLLPGNLLQMRGLLLITRTVRRRGNFYRRLLRPFLQYLWESWITNNARRLSLNFYGSYHRTNNSCESHNRNLNRLVGVRHPNIYRFIEALRGMEETSYADLDALHQGLQPSRRRRASAVANDRALRNLGRGLRLAADQRGMAVLRFLFRAAFTVRKFVNDRVFEE